MDAIMADLIELLSNWVFCIKYLVVLGQSFLSPSDNSYQAFLENERNLFEKNWQPKKKIKVCLSFSKP